METETFTSNLKYINLNGVTINIEERMNLQLAFETLKADFKLDSLFFWGKIIGTVKDYFIAYSLDYTQMSHGFPKKVFYWCSGTNYVFASLPEIQDKYLKQFEQMKTYLTGEYDKVVIEVGGVPQVIDDDIVLPPKNVTELDRLSYIIRTIDNSCQAVPQGAYKFTPLQEVVKNEAFKGLDKYSTFTINYWQHFRPIQQRDKIGLMSREEAVYNNQFLDEVQQDFPKGCWSLVKDCTETIATLKSLLWPGFYAYHRANTPIYGSLYVGYGIRNHDLPFML